MTWEFLSFLWDYALSKEEYPLISYQDGPVDETFFEDFNYRMRFVRSYHAFINFILLEKLADVSPSHRQYISNLYNKHSKSNMGYFFLKTLRTFHRDEPFKKVHGRYPLEELVEFKSDGSPLILVLLSILSRAVPKFHKGLDLGDPNNKRHVKLEDRI